MGIDYSIGTLDGYAETGSPGFDAVFAHQGYDSLITRVGGQVTHSTPINWGRFQPQLRLEYARENLNEGTSVFRSPLAAECELSGASPATNGLGKADRKARLAANEADL